MFSYLMPYAMEDIVEAKLTAPTINLPFPAPHLSVWSCLEPMYVIKLIIIIEHVGQPKDLATHEHDLATNFKVYL